MTYSEVLDEIQAYNQREKERAKDRNQLCALWVHQLAAMINLAVCDPKHFPATPAKAFPEIFHQEPAAFDWQRSKENWSAYAKRVNARRGGGANDG